MHRHFVEFSNMNEQAYQQIKSMLFSGKLIQRQKLIYNDLCDRLDMSKTPIIEALGRLQQEGFVKLIPNRGYFVKEVTIKEIEDLFEAREALEIYSLKEAIKKQTEENLKKLEERMQQHRDYIPPIYDQKKILLDGEFHVEIALISGNEIIVRLLRQVFERVYFTNFVALLEPSRLSVSHLEHFQILTLIQQRDYISTEKAMRSHLQAAKENIISINLPNDDEKMKNITTNY